MTNIVNPLIGIDETEQQHIIEQALMQSKRQTGSNWESYNDCEIAAFNLLFPKGWAYSYKKRDDSYQGKTIIGLELSDYQGIEFYYWWGSCGGCDILEGDGPVEAVKMIIKEIIDATIKEKSKA